MKVCYITNILGDLTKLDRAIRRASKMGCCIFINGGDFCGKYTDFTRFVKHYKYEIEKCFKENMTFVQAFGDLDNSVQFFHHGFNSYNMYFPVVCGRVPTKIRGLNFFAIPHVTDTRFMVQNYVATEKNMPYDFMPFSKASFVEGILRSSIGGFVEMSNITSSCVAETNEILIGLIHNPPFNTPISLDYNNVDRGSRAIRQYIEEQQPMVTLHGHVTNDKIENTEINHIMIGKTICINPGSSNMVVLDYRGLAENKPNIIVEAI